MKRNEICEKYIQSANIAQQSGQTEEAITILAHGFKETHGDGFIALQLGKLLSEKGQYRKAARFLEIAGNRLKLPKERTEAKANLQAISRNLNIDSEMGVNWRDYYCGIFHEPDQRKIVRLNPQVILTGIKVEKFFDTFDYSISFRDEYSSVVILTGPNGTGKSSILHLISALYHWDLARIAKLGFGSCTLEFAEYIISKRDMIPVEISSIQITRKRMKRYSVPNTETIQLNVKLISPKGRVQRKGKATFHFNKESRRCSSVVDGLIASTNKKSTDTLPMIDMPDWLVPYFHYRGAVYLDSNRLQSVIEDAFPGLLPASESMLAISSYSNYMIDLLPILKQTGFDENLKGSERLELFCELINKRIINKSFTLDSKEGFVIKTKEGKVIDPEDLSTGEQHLIVMFFVLLFNQENTLTSYLRYYPIVMIDEPEISMHVAWQNDFISDIKAIAQLIPGKYIIATHSPFIINNHWDLAVELGGDQK